MSNRENERGATLHVMTTYDATGNEVATVCQCWFGRSHLGEALPGQPVVGAAISAGDLTTAMPGHETWSAADGCACGYACPSIEDWQAHVQSL
ncbi:hypothetical protein [Amycolatopsis anabasis]|uniref:hypothetical protein n=1 Tax=Amycolatopsis anabasis TaxID=1840409 RepID=UPI00131B17D5|nr:hypothetical protein [Amycolatopsis anabasis]